MTNETYPDEIYQLIKTISDLQRDKQKDWVSWRQVAKYQEGSEELAEQVSGWADLPAFSHLFTQDRNGRVVCLTTESRAVLQTAKPQVKSLPEQVSGFVKHYASQLRRLRFEVNSIVPIGKSQRRIVHAIQVVLGDAVIPNEAPVRIISEAWGKGVNGRIVGQDAEDGLLYLALESHFRMDQLPAYLEVDRAFLLHQLAESLGKLTDIPELGFSILNADPSAIFPVYNRDSAVVGEALASLRTPWTRFLWGPPGAGKTYGLARLMLRLLEKNPNERILLVAPSNLAVDVALLQLINQLQGHSAKHLLNDRRILRYGYPRKTEILSQSCLLGSEANEEISRAIAKKGKELKAANVLDLPERDQAVLRAQLFDLQEQLKLFVLEHVAGCQVVATTTAQAYSSNSPITAQKWDTILVDEVTMVPPAICLYLSSLAKKRLLLAGDPRQLGPIFEAKGSINQDVEMWMGNDVYDFAKLSTGRGESRSIQAGDFRLARITSQRRCSHDVWQPIKHLYPDVENAVNEQKRTALRMVYPGAGRGIALIDVSQERDDAHCELVQKSWANSSTAQLAVDIVRQIISQSEGGSEPSIAIITPYRAQYRTIKQLLRKLNLQQKVEVGTIHQFQGSEADVVVFDMVDGPGRTKLGRLLQGDTGLRLVNVAISRARGKVIVLANRAWCRTSMKRPQNPILWDMVVGNTAVRLQQITGAEHPQPLHKSKKAKTQTQSDPLTASTNTKPLALMANFTPEKIWTMVEGDVYFIPNINVKRQLHRILSQGELFSEYDADRHMSIWEGSGKQYRIDHDKKLVLCEY